MTAPTERIIDALAEDLRPASRLTPERRLALGLAAGMAGSGLVMAAALGVRADLWTALHGVSFWMKALYCASWAAIACPAAARLSRPDAPPPRRPWLGLAPAAAVGLLAARELILSPRREWLELWLGKSWWMCPFLVFGLSAPIFAGLLWAFSKLAPTRLRLAGAAAGLTAGASAALVYCLHCPEWSAAFLLTWYSAGIGLAGLAGALLGPRLLRW